MEDDGWKDFVWPDWVPQNLREQIQGFWGASQHRHLKQWIENADYNGAGRYNGKMPEFGETVTVIRCDNGDRFTGRFIHAWNNIGRIVLPDGSYRVVSSCDTYTSPEATKWESLAIVSD
jgi:hypothetical protein